MRCNSRIHHTSVLDIRLAPGDEVDVPVPAGLCFVAVETACFKLFVAGRVFLAYTYKGTGEASGTGVKVDAFVHGFTR